MGSPHFRVKAHLGAPCCPTSLGAAQGDCKLIHQSLRPGICKQGDCPEGLSREGRRSTEVPMCQELEMETLPALTQT